MILVKISGVGRGGTFYSQGKGRRMTAGKMNSWERYARGMWPQARSFDYNLLVLCFRPATVIFQKGKERSG